MDYYALKSDICLIFKVFAEKQIFVMAHRSSGPAQCLFNKKYCRRGWKCKNRGMPHNTGEKEKQLWQICGNTGRVNSPK